MQPQDPSVPGETTPVPPPAVPVPTPEASVPTPVPPPAVDPVVQPGLPTPPPPPASVPPPPPPPPPVAPPPAYSAAPVAGPSDEKTPAMIAHIGGGLTCFIAPLIVWLMKKDQGGFAATEAKEALNFQITMLILYISAVILSIIPILGCLIAILPPFMWIASLVLAIMGGIKAGEGKAHKYPFVIRLIN